MIIRYLSEATSVEWGSGVSRRLLLESDGMGFTLADTTVRPGSTSRMEYKNHLEAVYCLEGSGQLIDSNGETHMIEPGVMYAMDKNEPHILFADPVQGMRVICVFNPPLKGSERHNFSSADFSHY